MYGLKYSSRCLTAVAAQREQSSWLVGTTALREENEIHLLTKDENTETLTCKEVYAHRHEIWDIASSPALESLFFTVYNAGETYEATLWQASEASKLESKMETKGKQKNVRKALWSPDTASDLVALASVDSINLWSLSRDEGAVSSSTPAGEIDNLLAVSWNHLNHNLICASCSHSLKCIDLRTMSPTLAIDNAHEMAVRDVDFSKTNQHLLATGGDDCKMCIWDLRKPQEPVVKVSNHSHWVWQSRFNPFHESLVLTSSSDSLVQLWNLREEDEGENEMKSTGKADLKPHTFDEHEDSVYGVSWSTADPWTFLSLSYDGRVMCNQCPSNVKYKILL